MMTSPTSIDDLNIDLLGNIVGRLPAVHFASADCVSRSWNRACRRVLSRPKLSSACSFNPDLEVAVESVVNKVLSEPIRPHFAIASACREIDFPRTHQLITKKLGSKIPVITNCSRGVIGRDAISDEFDEKPSKFVKKITAFSTFISGCISPAAIIMFSFKHTIGGHYDAVALVFVMDRNKPPGIGETQFHAALSSGLLPIGHAYKVTRVKDNGFQTWFIARREGSQELLDANTIWNLAYEDVCYSVPVVTRISNYQLMKKGFHGKKNDVTRG
ncbi:putative F-box domain-containing protein [Helianthus annuus]|nr:putative F-box domain-containing protein [Helianthus annuus]